MLDLKRELIRSLSESDITAIIPKEVDKIIESMVEHRNPLRQNLPRKPGSGAGVPVNRRTGAGTEPTFYSDTDPFDESTGSYSQVVFTYKTIGCQGKVTRKAQAIGANYADLLANEMEERSQEFRDKEEWGYFWGSVSTDPKQFDGLNVLTHDDNRIAAGDAAGGSLTLDMLDQVVDAVRGTPDMIICSKRTRRRIRALLQTQQRFVNTTKVKGGFELMSYNDIPIYVSNQIPDTIQVDTDGKTIVSITAGTLSALFIVDTEKVYVSELTPLTVKPLAKTSSQYDLFDIYADEVLVVRNPYACAEIVGIA
ncbi:phage major capsid protein [Candidatus Bathyarchaeota archaeon]|nr:MAG: phage major capsid protein [Candidatus Bathyarchaeota archaeon]